VFAGAAREGCDCGSEVETVHRGLDRKGPVPLRKSKNLAGEGIVRKISSPKKSSECSNLCKFSASGQGTWVTGSVAPVLASESAHSIGKSSMTGDPLET